MFKSTYARHPPTSMLKQTELISFRHLALRGHASTLRQTTGAAAEVAGAGPGIVETWRWLMCLLHPSCERSFRMLRTITLSVMVLGAIPARPASAQTGVIAFQDHCNGLLYAMRGDGTGRMPLPLPPLPQPASEYRYSGARVLDVTTSGPLTVVYYVGIGRRASSGLTDFGLFAVQLNEVNGVLLPGSATPVRLTVPSDNGIVGVNPNSARSGSFSSAEDHDRLALVAESETASVLMTVSVDRDESSRITGLSDLTVVADLYSLGVPDPSVSTTGFTGTIDYSPDGSSIVASIYHDLWMVHLDGFSHLVGADLLTADSNGAAEWNPSYSPDGTRVAYTAGPVTTSGGVRDTDIYSVALGTGASTRVTTKQNKGGAASARDRAMWTANSAWIGFTAYTSSTPRKLPCSALVNSEIFLIKAEGSSTASQITHTNGTSVEGSPKWGF